MMTLLLIIRMKLLEVDPALLEVDWMFLDADWKGWVQTGVNWKGWVWTLGPDGCRLEGTAIERVGSGRMSIGRDIVDGRVLLLLLMMIVPKES